MKLLKANAIILVILISFFGCQTPTSNSTEIIEYQNSIFIRYLGQDENTNLAKFEIGNMTSEFFTYAAYGQNNPSVNTQQLIDGEWEYMFYNWCLTGVENFPLNPGSSYLFNEQNPYHPCTWRIEVYINDETLDSSYSIYSESIEYVDD